MRRAIEALLNDAGDGDLPGDEEPGMEALMDEIDESTNDESLDKDDE